MTKEALHITGSYGWAHMDPKRITRRFQVAVKRMAQVREEHPFDTIVFRGISGAAFGFVAGVALQTKVVYVRKEGEKSHGYKLECNSNSPIKSYIIVDDFVCSGDTIRAIVEQINKRAKQNEQRPPACAGVLLYDSQMQNRLFEINSKLKVPLWPVNWRTK
jgi:orotate phosphoribosyltransferase